MSDERTSGLIRGAGSLPVYFTSFVGRERELEALLRSLGSSRLVTVVGPGGIGKTRLAVETARHWVDANAGDVVFVDLSTMGPHDLSDAVFRAIAPSTAAAGEDALFAFLAQGTALLVLDNCEHIAAAAVSLADGIRRRCASVTIVATSRSALGLEGEVRFPLGPIDDVSARTGLFLDRAAASNATLVFSERDLRDVEAICAGLDGIPLGIELAAASLSGLPVAEVRARLTSALDSFESPIRAAPDRQRSLRGAIQWSLDLLSPAERLLFGRLAVFSGGWRLDSAEKVCSENGIEPREVVGALRRLVDQGLVLLDVGSGRYRLLEPIRQIAAELSTADSERHAEYFASLLHVLGRELNTPQGPSAAQRLWEEDSNFRAAIAWAMEAERWELALAMVAAGASGWSGSRRAAQWSDTFRAVTRNPRARRHPELWAAARILESSFGPAGIDAAEAIERVQEATDFLPEGALRRSGKIALGWHLTQSGRFDEAEEMLLGCLREARDAGMAEQVNTTLLSLASGALLKGDREAHERWCLESRAFSRSAGDAWGEAAALANLANGYVQQGRGPEAEVAISQSIALRKPFDEGGTPPTPAGILGFALLLQGKAGQARQVFRGMIADLLAGVPDLGLLANAVAGSAIALGVQRDSEIGGRLVGAVSAAIARREVPWPQSALEQLTNGFRYVEASMGADRFAREVEAGKELSLVEAGELVLVHAPDQAAATQAPGSPDHPANLTAREAEVLRLLAAGNTNRQIAQQLVLSLRTVETHIFNIYAKANVGGRAGATAWAIAHGLYSPPT